VTFHEARQAKVLTAHEAKRIAINIAKQEDPCGPDQQLFGLIPQDRHPGRLLLGEHRQHGVFSPTPWSIPLPINAAGPSSQCKAFPAGVQVHPPPWRGCVLFRDQEDGPARKGHVEWGQPLIRGANMQHVDIVDAH
jgi:hypothetical protein